MEICDYLTNVLSINELSSIRYYYLEPVTKSEPEYIALAELEAIWRARGALVICHQSGLWLFGKQNKAEPLPSPAVFDSEGHIQFQDFLFAVKHQGVYETTSLGKGSKSLTTPSKTHNGIPLPSVSLGSNIRNAQLFSSKSPHSNAATRISRENVASFSPAKNDSEAAESLVLPRDIQEHFISAVLAALVYQMCHESSYIALNGRTLALLGSEFMSGNKGVSGEPHNKTLGKRMWIISLDIHLTSLDTLIIKAWATPPVDFSCILTTGQSLGLPSSLIQGATLFLAPSGKVGRYLGPVTQNDPSARLDMDDNSETHTKSNSAPSEKFQGDESIERWKNRCLNWLFQKGIKTDLLECSEWLMVQIYVQAETTASADAGDAGLWTPTEKISTIAWPAILCFERTNSDSSEGPIFERSRGYDPLSFAEGWFTAKAARETTVTKRQRERESAAAILRAQAEFDSKNLAPNNYSPLALRRASIVGAVYPTPPDGIQPAIGATPSFDGNASTPGHPNPQILPTDAENIATSKIDADYTENSLWETNGARRDPNSSTFDFEDNGNDDPFPDMGGDLFGETDITDADFNFFDEPDAVENIQDSIAIDDSTSSTNLASDNATDNNTLYTRAKVLASHGGESDVAMAESDQALQYTVDGMESSKVHNAKQMADSSVDRIELSRFADIPVSMNPSPPLSPDLIFKRLSIAGGTTHGIGRSATLNRTMTLFGGIPFDSSLFSFGEKYGSHGRFMYPPVPKPIPQRSSMDLPKTGDLKKRKTRRSITAEFLDQTLVSVEDPLIPELESPESQSDSESPRYPQFASPISDQDDTIISAEDEAITFHPNLKRKRENEVIRDDFEMITSSSDPKVDLPYTFQNSNLLDVSNRTLLDSNPADWSLAEFLSSPQPLNVANSLSDSDYVAAAQVLTEQAISRTLHIPLLIDTNRNDYDAECSIDEHGIASLVHLTIVEAVKSCFGRGTECNVAAFAEIQDSQPIGQNNRVATRPLPTPRAPHSTESSGAIATFILPPPHLELQRSDSKLSLLPSAVPFWENLGLGPYKGSKDVSALCIYPDREGMSESIDAFLENIRNAYESSRLGSHERFSEAESTNGVIPIDYGDGSLLSVADHKAILQKIKEASDIVENLLNSGIAVETNIVIYYVFDSSRPELIVPICSAFHDLFGLYKDRLVEDKIPASNELVLQLVPSSFVASHSSLVIPSPSEYTRLAIEVYDRCVEVKTGTAMPSIVLEQPLPKTIDFKLTPNPSASPLQENSCMHIAYAQSLDDRWVTAAWTDNTGTRQVSASYCLGRRNTSLSTTFSRVAKEIWETTLDMIAFRKVNWRIIIAKCGVMDPHEMDFWRDLATTESNAQISLTLVTVDTAPSLRIIPPSITIAPNALAAQSSIYTTPVSTPQAAFFSPEPSGNPSTPTRDSGPANPPTPNDSNIELPKVETDATLVDISDQTWGAVLSHRLNNSRSLLEFNPTLISGYLIKRSGATPSDVPIVLEVNIVQSEVNPRMYDPLLREILGLYRGLATLARVRGCVDPAKDGRPWHVAAAEKGVNALYVLM